MVELLLLPPVLKGLLIVGCAGFTFPITGVYLLRLNLLPLRFMLMHGAILGGAIALAMDVNPFVSTIIVNLIMVLLIIRSSRSLNTDPGIITTFFMVISIALAFIVIYKFNVAAKDTLSLLWGSLYTTTWTETIGIIFFSFGLVAFQVIFRRKLRALFFDREIAYSSGVNEKGLYYSVVLITALTVAIAMKLIGALLLDAILLLPPIIASFRATSLRGMLKGSILWGGGFAIGGFLFSLAIDVPVSSAIAALASLIFIVHLVIKR